MKVLPCRKFMYDVLGIHAHWSLSVSVCSVSRSSSICSLGSFVFFHDQSTKRVILLQMDLTVFSHIPVISEFNKCLRSVYLYYPT